jgi:hypothetical protein
MKPGSAPGAILPLDEKSVDQLYGLEPVFEPAATATGTTDSTPFVQVQCPYCGESFETRLDLTAGSSSYVEDCQVCCQPIELDVAVNANGTLKSLNARRGDS